MSFRNTRNGWARFGVKNITEWQTLGMVRLLRLHHA